MNTPALIPVEKRIGLVAAVCYCIILTTVTDGVGFFAFHVFAVPFQVMLL